MLYLAKEWQLGGYAKLKELFDQGDNVKIKFTKMDRLIFTNLDRII